jgi:hypothetical protein
MPGLLRDIVVDALSTEPDMEIAGEIRSFTELDPVLDDRTIDIVVASERDGALACDKHRVLEACAYPRFLVLTDGGSSAYLHWMKPQTSSLGALTPETLVRAIRSAARLESDPQSES